MTPTGTPVPTSGTRSAPAKQRPPTQQALGVKPIEPGLWSVSSLELAHPPYIVRQGADGKYSCDCPAFAFKHSREGSLCKHQQAVAGLSGPAPTHVFTCGQCGNWPALANRSVCSHCLVTDAERAEPVDMADYTADELFWGDRESLLLAHVPDSTPEQIAESEAIKAQVRAELPAMLEAERSAAERNAAAVKAHELNGTLVIGARTNPLADFYYGRR